MNNSNQPKIKIALNLVWKQCHQFTQRQDGATAIEYALIASATGLALIAALPAIEAAIGSNFADFAQWFTDITL